MRIADFPEKLRIAMGRANLARAAVARDVGVDKSVVARWLTGALHPGDHSLARLSPVLAAHLAGFHRAAWDAPVAAFARQLGVAAAEPAPRAPPLLARAAEWAAPGLPEALVSYGGLWAFAHFSPSGSGHVRHVAGEFRPGAGVMEFEIGWDAFAAQGPAFLLDGHLYAALETSPVRALWFFHFNAVMPWQVAGVIDGITLVRGALVNAAPAANRIIGFRLQDHVPDNEARARRLTAALACARVLSAGREIEPPRRLRAALGTDEFGKRAGPVLRVPRQSSWTCTREQLEYHTGMAAQREAAAWIQGLYASALGASRVRDEA